MGFVFFVFYSSHRARYSVRLFLLILLVFIFPACQYQSKQQKLKILAQNEIYKAKIAETNKAALEFMSKIESEFDYSPFEEALNIDPGIDQALEDILNNMSDEES